MSVSISWHGHATLSLKVGQTKLLVDPFFDGNPTAKLKAEEVEADYILLTHGHGDHVGDCLAIAKRTGAMVISNFEIANWITAQGHENVHGQHIGGGFNHPFGRVKLTIAFHGSAMPDGSYGGQPAGFLLEVEEKRIYIAGDTALFSDMSLIGRGGLDLAVLPIGDNYTMGIEDGIEATKLLKPRLVIGYHCNTWPLIAANLSEWSDRVQSETESEPLIPELDRAYLL